MKKKKIKSNITLGVLFFLPVLFVLVLSLSKDNYEPLEVVNKKINDIPQEEESSNIKFEDHLTVVAFLGKKPLDYSAAALNLKELVYDKFKGFKKFQIVVLTTNSVEAKKQSETLFKEIANYEDLRFWHFVPTDEKYIKHIFKSLKTDVVLNENLATNHVFIIDTELNQRGRLDDREDKEKEKNKPVYPLYSYNCVEVAEIKNKMAAEDLRVLFKEYRDKRKGDFNSNTRRADDLKGTNEEN